MFFYDFDEALTDIMNIKKNSKSNARGINIMLMSASYPPIIDSCARLYSELSESLRGISHKVTVICEYPAKNSPVDRSYDIFSPSIQG